MSVSVLSALEQQTRGAPDHGGRNNESSSPLDPRPPLQLAVGLGRGSPPRLHPDRDHVRGCLRRSLQGDPRSSVPALPDRSAEERADQRLHVGGVGVVREGHARSQTTARASSQRSGARGEPDDRREGGDGPSITKPGLVRAGPSPPRVPPRPPPRVQGFSGLFSSVRDKEKPGASLDEKARFLRSFRARHRGFEPLTYGSSARGLPPGRRAARFVVIMVSMRRMSFVEAKAHLSELVDEAEHKHRPVLILRHGKPAAALVPVERNVQRARTSRRPGAHILGAPGRSRGSHN